MEIVLPPPSDTCPVCGNGFERNPSRRHLYCSKECGQKAFRDRRRAEAGIRRAAQRRAMLAAARALDGLAARLRAAAGR